MIKNSASTSAITNGRPWSSLASSSIKEIMALFTPEGCNESRIYVWCPNQISLCLGWKPALCLLLSNIICTRITICLVNSGESIIAFHIKAGVRGGYRVWKFLSRIKKRKLSTSPLRAASPALDLEGGYLRPVTFKRMCERSIIKRDNVPKIRELGPPSDCINRPRSDAAEVIVRLVHYWILRQAEVV